MLKKSRTCDKHDWHDHRSVSCLHCLFPAVTPSLIVLQGSKLLKFGIVVPEESNLRRHEILSLKVPNVEFEFDVCVH